MVRKSYNIRRYPHFVRKVQPLPIVDMDSIGNREEVFDSSTGESLSQNWITDRGQTPKAQWDYEVFLRPKEEYFIRLLINEDFLDSDRNDSTYFIRDIARRYKDTVQTWILDLFKARQDDEHFLMQLLRLLRCFPYEFLAPASFYLAGMGVHHRSDFVKSEALSLLDHWGNLDVMKMIDNFEPPMTPWLRMKYYAIRESIERYATLQKNR